MASVPLGVLLPPDAPSRAVPTAVRLHAARDCWPVAVHDECDEGQKEVKGSTAVGRPGCGGNLFPVGRIDDLRRGLVRHRYDASDQGAALSMRRQADGGSAGKTVVLRLPFASPRPR